MSESKLLGKQVEYPQSYAPEMLVAVPREINRTEYSIDGSDLPFTGLDVWHAYELSFLTKKGFPVTGVLKLTYPCNNPVIVESKSLKLYLNSFNMERFGDSVNEGISVLSAIIRKDLSKLLQTEVELKIFTKQQHTRHFDFDGYSLLEEMQGAEEITFDTFNESPGILQVEKNEHFELRIATHLLRSNCKVTFQPDWGSAFIYIKGERKPDLRSLLKYLVSFRNENHFHEEVCEVIYKRLWDIYKPEQLAVTCIYTRRGGIDISPVRVSHEQLLPKNLADIEVLSWKLLRQ